MTSNGTYATLADLSVPFTPPPAADFDDRALLEAQGSLAEIRRRVDAASAALAGEIEHRSRRELGHSGLAQRLGARTPQKLVQLVTGVSSREANSLVRVGSIVREGTQESSSSPWLDGVVARVAEGRLSVEAADVIRGALGSPDESVSIAALSGAAALVLDEAAGLTLERLAARAREMRHALDLEHVGDREAMMRGRRFLHVTPLPDGMTRLSGLLDPESAATVVAAFDAATSPRRGGPRFVDGAAAARAERLINDERTTEQIALDSFVELIRIGTHADSGSVLGSTRPTVRILVTKAELDSGVGAGHIEGQRDPVSIDTVRRRICSEGALPILFDGRQPVDQGRKKRFFTSRQKVLLAARDGGCIFPSCDRPPSWTEAHHIDEWQHGGKTDIADGVLLCRHHHLLLHNNGWRCVRVSDNYFFVPPEAIDPTRALVPAQKRSAACEKLAG